MLTLKKINTELAALDTDVRLARGDGFFFFYTDAGLWWTVTVVWADKLTKYDLAGWVACYEGYKLTNETNRKKAPNSFQC